MGESNSPEPALGDRAVLLSIDPEWAEAILDGQKPWEYRRTAPSIEPPYVVYLYASAPVSAVVGQTVVDRVQTGPVHVVVTSTAAETPHSHDDLFDYFEGCETATALHIDTAERETQVSLETLRELDIAPTPNFRYVPEVIDGFLGDAGEVGE